MAILPSNYISMRIFYCIHFSIHELSHEPLNILLLILTAVKHMVNILILYSMGCLASNIFFHELNAVENLF